MGWQETLVIDDGFCDGKLTLKAWAGFQSRTGAYGAKNSKKPSSGAVYLSIVQEENESITPAQIAAVEYLRANQDEIRDAVLKKLFADYPRLQKIFRKAFGDEDVAETMPDLKSVEDFKKLVGLNIVHVLEVENEKVAYTGLEFGCTWDGEHGVGALLHKNRVVKLSAADTAFDHWEAKSDLRKTSKQKSKIKPKPTAKKKK